MVTPTPAAAATMWPGLHFKSRRVFLLRSRSPGPPSLPLKNPTMPTRSESSTWSARRCPCCSSRPGCLLLFVCVCVRACVRACVSNDWTDCRPSCQGVMPLVTAPWRAGGGETLTGPLQGFQAAAIDLEHPAAVARHDRNPSRMHQQHMSSCEQPAHSGYAQPGPEHRFAGHCRILLRFLCSFQTFGCGKCSASCQMVSDMLKRGSAAVRTSECLAPASCLQYQPASLPLTSKLFRAVGNEGARSRAGCAECTCGCKG